MTRTDIPPAGDFNSVPDNQVALTVIYRVIDHEGLWSWLKDYKDNKLDANYRFLRQHHQLAEYNGLLFDEIFSHMINIAKCGWTDYITDIMMSNRIFEQWGNATPTANRAVFFSVKDE